MIRRLLMAVLLIGILSTDAHAFMTLLDPGEAGPVGYWKLNESTGTDADDLMGARDGTLTNFDGTGDWVSGKLSNAVNFDGTDDHILIPAYTGFDFGGTSQGFTICAWINTNGVATDHDIVRKGANDTTAQYLLKIEADNDSIKMCVYDTGASDFACAESAASSISTGTWVFVAGVVNGNSISTYINGASSGTPATFGTIKTSTEQVAIGGDEYPFDGEIDDVRIYNQALPESKLAYIYNSGTGREF